MKRLAGILISISSGFITFACTAQELTDLSFDELMQIEVTTVSKKAEKLSQAAAAVYVVTQEEIRRSGATSIPEALKLVPGVHVAQVDPNKWAVGIRGFNGRLATKLLVLMDGRSLYTSTYSGVYWENHDYIMADIKRIEVIRGPGATMWGTNAVNGVINIITKEASETTDGFARVAGGNELRALGAVRQGVEFSDHTQVRFYAKGKNLDGAKSNSGDDQENGGDYLQTGFRLDWQENYDQWATFQGSIYNHDLDQEHAVPQYTSPFGSSVYQDSIETDGGNLMANWTRVTGLASELTLSLWYDYYQRKEIKYNERLDTVDFSIQHQFKPWKNHDLIWGGGYRWSQNDVTNGEMVSVSDSKVNYDIWNLFMQDKILFPEQDVSVTIGTKVESNDYSDIEIQPNIRASWVPSDQVTLWGAISRATRIPSRGETDFVIVGASLIPTDESPNPQIMLVNGNDNFDSEQLDAYELGIRWMPHSDLSLDFALFYNDYKNLRSYELDNPYVENIDGQSFLILPFELANNIKGHSQGGELLATWQATESSRYQLTYSYINIELEDTESGTFSDMLIGMDIDRTPEHQVSLWASYDLTPDWELDIRVFYKDEQPWTYNSFGSAIDAYTNADIRIGWQSTDWMQLSLSGHNILHNEQQEFTSENWSLVSELERSIYADVTINW